MDIFGTKKKNGDYLIKILTGVEGLQKDSGHQKENLLRIESDVKEHKTAEYKRRDLDRDWQKGIDLKLAERHKCARDEDVSILMSDRKGIRLIWKVVIGILGFAALVLGVVLTLKRLELL